MQKSKFSGMLQRTIKALSDDSGKRFKDWFWLPLSPH